jgi:signal transduction histidine kinase
MLVQLEKQKDQLEEFTQIISHNLRAPLSNLVLLSDMVESKDNIEDKLRLLKKQNQIVTSLHNTFEQLVVAGQVKSDFKSEREYIDLENGFLEILKMLQGEILSANIQVSYDFSSAKSVYYPSKYFESIFLNLLTNAIRYRSTDKVPEIKIRSWKSEGWTNIEVADNGLGIDLKQHGRNIFKLHKTFHGHPKAIGYGLFITRTQVEAMGGSIRVESSVDKGSKFIVQLARDK